MPTMSYELMNNMAAIDFVETPSPATTTGCLFVIRTVYSTPPTIENDPTNDPLSLRLHLRSHFLNASLPQLNSTYTAGSSPTHHASCPGGQTNTVPAPACSSCPSSILTPIVPLRTYPTCAFWQLSVPAVALMSLDHEPPGCTVARTAVSLSRVAICMATLPMVLTGRESKSALRAFGELDILLGWCLCCFKVECFELSLVFVSMLRFEDSHIAMDLGLTTSRDPAHV